MQNVQEYQNDCRMEIKLIKEIRTQTGASFGDCKKALEQANGDLQKAIEIAAHMLKDQQDQENEVAKAQSEDEAINQLKSEFDKLTEIISDKDDVNRLRKATEYIKEKYDLGLSEEDKKKYYVTSILLSPLKSVPDDIKNAFISRYYEEKNRLLDSVNSQELKNLQIKIKDKITKQLTKHGAVSGQIECMRIDPVLFSTTVDLTKGYNILYTECMRINELVNTLLSDSWYDNYILRYSENGTDLNQLYEESSGSFSIENESPDGESEYYVATEAMKSLSNGPFEQYGFKGQWEEVDSKELEKLLSLESNSNGTSSNDLFLEIIELFIQKTQ